MVMMTPVSPLVDESGTHFSTQPVWIGAHPLGCAFHADGLYSQRMKMSPGFGGQTPVCPRARNQLSPDVHEAYFGTTPSGVAVALVHRAPTSLAHQDMNMA